jgi:energy-converting hydrogenase Eha subunit B
MIARHRWGMNQIISRTPSVRGGASRDPVREWTMDYNAGFLIGALIGFVIGIVIGSSIGALFLMLSTRLVAKFVPDYWRAFGTALASGVVAMVISFIVGFFIGLIARLAGLPSAEMQPVAFVAGLVVAYLVATGFIRLIIKQPDGSALPWRSAFLVALVNALLGTALFALLVAGVHLLGMNATHPLNM